MIPRWLTTFIEFHWIMKIFLKQSDKRVKMRNLTLWFKGWQLGAFFHRPYCYQCIRCKKKIRIKIFVLWFHGRCHIEQIDVRLLNRTQDMNDVSTWNLIQMLHRHRYTTLFSWNFKYLFQIWITVKSNMIGRFIVAMVTNSKHWRHDYVCYVSQVPLSQVWHR